MKSLFRYGVLTIVAMAMILPLGLMILLSLKSTPEQYTTFWELLTSSFTIVNYTDAFSTDNYTIYFLNSILVASVITIANLLFCYTSAYVFARKLNSKKTAWLFGSVLLVLFIPAQVIMIPLYKMMAVFGWLDTYAALILPWLVSPFGIFLVKQYLESVPKDIEEAARIDGASELRIIFRIVFPLCKPILSVLTVYIFLFHWNSFLFPFLFVSDPNLRTLPVGLAFYLGKQSIDWGHLMAGAGISSLPVLILFLFFQKQIIQSLTSGALKE
ncbi:MAG: carbohydrate ABC transporter permease [Candidatus Kapabacteria bacterium]|nr:carbohydrate ABC transporter permease [Candidatus Kapabacteria bacterium]